MTVYERTELKEKIISLKDMTDVISGTTIKYVCEIDGIGYWYDTSWEESDYSISQANDSTTIVAQKTTLPFNLIKGSTFRIIAVKDYTTTEPEITKMTLSLEELQNILGLGTEVIIDVTDSEGNPMEDIVIRMQLANIATTGQKNPTYNGKTVITSAFEKLTDSNGECIVYLFPNPLIEPINTQWSIKVGSLAVKNYIIPVGAKVYLSDLTPVS